MEELAAASRAAVAAAKAAAAARAAGPLPDGWQKFMTAEGEPYYYHEASKKTQWAFPAPRPKVAINILTGPDVRDRYKYEACFYVRYDMHRFVEHKCTDDVLLSELKQLEPWGPNGIAFGITCDKLRADPFRRSWISDMLDRARLFEPIEYAETFVDADMASKQRQFPLSPLDATHHIHLIDSNWEKNHDDDNIAKIRKWVQVMVFNADESESSDPLGEEDRELAYREEEAELAELKKQRK